MFDAYVDKLIDSQNLQSQSCLKALTSYLRNKSKPLENEDDFRNSLVTFQTDMDFLRDDIERFRNQNMSPHAF